ncbi:hypothetical protein DW716_00715 [Absiella sp. AM27-20]|nr:hypothetical protein DW716_00715 [Absiella sp. AM27-20]
MSDFCNRHRILPTFRILLYRKYQRKRRLFTKKELKNRKLKRLQWISDRFVIKYKYSIGTYFSLLAYADEPIQHAWFLSPIVNMQVIVENMME